MINRATLECSACKTRVVTRTAIGHGANQVHTFRCPTCGIHISFSLSIDQEKIGFEYGRTPVNAKWMKDETGAATAIAFDSEVLLPRNALLISDPAEPSVSPFIMMVTVVRDIVEFKHEFGKQITVLRHRDQLDRLLGYLEYQNWDMLRLELGRLDVENVEDLALDDLRNHVYAFTQNTQRVITKDSIFAATSAKALIARAFKHHSVATKLFIAEYRTSKRLSSLWHQLRKARSDYFACAPALLPLLQLKHWKTPPVSLADCQILNKQFEPLKQLYIDCFETLARISVILLGFHGLGARGSSDVPTNKGGMSIWSFEKLQNANKPDHLKKAPDCAFLATALDTELRNGIGHNAARYDVATDEVVVYKQRGAVLEERRLHYTEFADRVLSVSSLLLELNLVAFLLLEAADGALE